MPYETSWLPGKRELILAMAKNWLTVLAAKKTPWHITDASVSELNTCVEDASAALALAQSSARTPVITARCKAVFDGLTGQMRFFKGHFFLSPPLTDTDYISLELKPKDTTRTPVPPPTAQAEADISRPGVHLLELYLRPVSGSVPDPHQSDYGYRIYYGILPAGGATVETATGTKRELLKAPVSGNELPFSKFTRRKKERFDFPQEDSGKTAYFCIRYENAKGDPGPWGPMFEAVIP